VVMLLVNIFSWHISSIYIMLAAGLFSLIVSTVLSAKGNGKKGAAK